MPSRGVESPGVREIVLLIRSLEIGGAQRQFVALAKGLSAVGMNVRALSFYPGGALRADLEAAGVPVADVGKRGRWDLIGFLWRLVASLCSSRPRAIYSFLPVANILALFVRPFLRDARIVWGVRASNMDLARYDWLSRVVAQIERFLARFADAVIANSQAGRSHHVRLGFPGQRVTVIENGVDTERFRFDAVGRTRLRRAWGIDDDALLIGVAARLDPMKDYETFLSAAALLVMEVPRARFVCVGTGPADYAGQLKVRADVLGIPNKVVWAGVHHDMAAVYSAFDIATSSSSYGEGFSNAIAEAMACGRVCVVTDVGDSARIVGGAGWVVPSGNAQALASTWSVVAGLPPHEREQRGSVSRARIEAEFSVRRMVERTLAVLNAPATTGNPQAGR